MPRMLLFSACLVLSLSIHVPALGQTPTSDPQALRLASQSISALTGGADLADVTVSTHVVSAAGSDVEDGTASFFAKGGDLSRIDLSLTADKRSEIRNASSGFPQGVRTSGGRTVPLALHNCWTDAAWFFPALSSLNSTLHPSVTLSYVGVEDRSGTTVQHLRAYYQLAHATDRTVRLAQRASTTDIYLDSSTLYPIAVRFNTHPDDDALTDIPVEIVYSNYQLTNGIPVPSRIQRYLQNSLSLDLVVTSVAVNTGLPDSLFAIQ